MANDRVLLSIDKGIATVVLNRAEKKNALDLAMFVALDKCIRTLRKDKRVRAIILTAKGEDFCSGLDVKSVMLSRVKAIKLLWKWLPGNANLAQRVSYQWRKIPAPVICAISGRCWGGGLQIALGADFRIACHDASFSIMEGRWGLIPDMAGTLALKELLACDKAMHLAMSAETFSSDKAKSLGLVYAIDETPIDAAKKLATSFIERSPDAIAAVKKLYHSAWLPNKRAILAHETFYQWRIFLGKNRMRAIQRQKSNSRISYLPRQRW